jgi:hypothetical protein
MMNEPDEDSLAYSTIEDALHTYPLAPAPAGLSAAIMRTVRASGRSRLAPRFRLTWLDYALGIFLAGMAALGVLLWQWLPPQWAARLHVQALLLEQYLRLAYSIHPERLLLVAVIAAGLAACVLAAALFATLLPLLRDVTPWRQTSS